MADIMGLDKFTKPKKKPSVRETLQNNQQAGITQQVATPEDTGVPSFTSPAISIPGPKDIQKRKEERKLVEQITQAPQFSRPEDFDRVLGQIGQISSDISPEKRKAFEERRNKITQAKDIAQKQFEETKDTNQWLRVAETLGHALTQLGAGAYGLKHNVDMSGIKFDKTDWSKNLDRAERELDRKLGLAKEEERAAEKAEGALERKLSEDTNFRKRAILQNYIAEQQAYKQQVLQTQRLVEQAKKDSKGMSAEEKARQRAAQKELSNIIRKQEQKVKLLDKAYGESQAASEGEKGASLDKVAKTLGGEQGAQFRQEVQTPVSIFGVELWKSANEEEAPKIVKGYLDQAKAALEDLKRTSREVSGISSPSQPQAGQLSPQLSGQDKQALDWANANPTDPRAKTIKQRLGR
jgi:hypothetical protein